MRVLRLIQITDASAGGPVEGLVRSSEVMMRLGHQVEVASLESEETVKGRGLPLPIYGLGGKKGGYGYNPRLEAWLRQNGPSYDAVLVHGIWNYTSFGAWRGLRGSTVPYFVYTHGMMDPWFREQYPAKHLKKQIYWWFAEGKVLRDARAVLFTSEEEKIRARGVFHGYSYKEQVVRYGTAEPSGDAEAQKASFLQAFPHLKGRRLLLFVSRIHQKKGCDLLIEAFARNIGSLPSDLDLVIGGPDQVGWKQELSALADRLGVASRIHWPGMLKGDLKWGAYRSAEAMILPSHQENFGIVVAEAMACSTPVLISDKINIWREVQQAGAGLVAADTVEGTEQLISRFYALSPEERSVMGRSGRAGFEKYFHIEAAARDLLRIIGAEQS